MPKMPCSIIMKIIEKFLLENCNSITINKYINDYYNSINIGIINKILKWLRTAFAHYIKDIYSLKKLGKAQGGSNISMEESMFTYSNDNKIWILEQLIIKLETLDVIFLHKKYC